MEDKHTKFGPEHPQADGRRIVRGNRAPEHSSAIAGIHRLAAMGTIERVARRYDVDPKAVRASVELEKRLAA